MALPIIEQIAANLLSSTSVITTVGGFFNNLTVKRDSMEPPSPTDKLVIIKQGKPQDLPDTWNIKKRRLWFGFVFYARPPEKEAGWVDTYLNSIAADLEKAIMADPRRGGLVDIDTVVHDPQFFYANQPGLLVGILMVSVISRVLRNDPTIKAPGDTNELFWQGGGVLHYAPYITWAGNPTTSVIGAWRRLTDLKITPRPAPATDTARNDRDGLVRPLDVQAIAWNQKYEIETDDFSPESLMLQIGAASVQDFTQSATPLVAIPHFVTSLDSVVPLVDDNGDALWNVASIQSVTNVGGSITYAAGSDYVADPGALLEGLLEIPPGSTITPGSAVLVSMTPAAISGERLLTAQETSSIRYRARIVWPAQLTNGVAQQLHVHGPLDAAIVPKAATRSPDDYSVQRFDLTVLDDGTDTPSGQLILPVGAMPDEGY